MRRLLAGLAGAALLAVLVPAGASALDECRGLQECVSVVGPWVVVPARSDGGLVTVSWELRCPLRNYVVGGTDARVTSRAIEVSIRGERGSPVSPGVTTRRAVLFTARTAASGGVDAFLPAIGCLPSRGGGGRAQTSVSRGAGVYPPGSQLVRRVVEGRVPVGGSAVVVARCPAGSRLVDAEHAIGFATKLPPSAAVLRSVTTQATSGTTAARVRAVRAAGIGRGVKALVQVGVTCAKAGS